MVDRYISALMESVLQRTGHCKDALKQDLSTSSLSKVLLLLDICGNGGVLLVFPTATGDHIADSLFTAFTAQDPLVDLRNDFPVLAASSSVNSYKLRQLLMTSREGVVRLVRAQPKSPEPRDEPPTFKKLRESGYLHMVDVRLYTVGYYSIFSCCGYSQRLVRQEEQEDQVTSHHDEERSVQGHQVQDEPPSKKARQKKRRGRPKRVVSSVGRLTKLQSSEQAHIYSRIETVDKIIKRCSFLGSETYDILIERDEEAKLFLSYVTDPCFRWRLR